MFLLNLILGLFRWLTSSPAKVARRVAHSIGLPVVKGDRGVWNVAACVRNTYRVSLHIWCVGDAIFFMASSQIRIERDFLLREFLLCLLEENHVFQDASFRLVPCGTERCVVLGRVVDFRHFPEALMKDLSENLIAKMQQMIAMLYARGLIIPGPEPAESK